MARAQAMAAINASLQPQPIVIGQQPPAQQVVSPHPAPGVNAPTPLTSLTSGEKRAVDTQRQANESSAKLDSQAATQQRADMQQDLRQQSAFDRSASATVNAASGIFKNTSLTLGSLPMPGGFALPLIVLALFFFLLLPVNGHTRFVWLWLTLTGNAEIAGAPSDFGDANPNPGGDNPFVGTAPGAGGDFSYTPGFTFTPGFTGVEEYA